MRKIISIVIGFCIMISGFGVSAANNKTVNVYTISYNTGTDKTIAETIESGYSEVLETTITKIRPCRENYEFLGWSYNEKDYVNTTLLQPGEKIKLSSSVELHAIWRDKTKVRILYQDGGREVLPSQLVKIGDTRITEMIPQKDGYVFSGWSYSGAEGTVILAPGEKISAEKNTVLLAIWEKMNFELPKLELRDSVPGAAFFGCENAEQFNSIFMSVRSFDGVTQNKYMLRDGRVKVDDLDDGAYEAQIISEKHGVEYKGNRVNFVISQGVDVDNPLAVFMDGRMLNFDLPPVLLGGHTYVTLRYFCEYLGADVLWENESRTAVITYNGTRMKIRENADVCVVDGVTYQLPAPTVIMSDRMFIPLRSVAEFCNCEVLWDPARKVYMFSDKRNIFDTNLFTMCGNNEKFMCIIDGNMGHTTEESVETMWLFDTVDEQRGIYEIYNFSDLTKPLEVEMSEMEEEQPLRIWEKSGYDGYLWKVTKCGDGEYFIQPANNDELFLDATNLCITSDPTKVYVNEVYR